MSYTLPVVRSVGAVGAGAANTNPGLPAGVVLGDLLLCFVEHLAGETITSTNYRARILNSAAGSPGTGLTLLWRYATADASDAITLAGATDHTVARMLAIETGTWQNAFGNGNNSDVYGGINSIMGAAVADDETSSDSTINWSGLTTLLDNSLVFLAAALELDRSASGVTATSLTNLTQQIDNNSGGVGNAGSLYVVTGTKATAGAVVASSSNISGGAVVNKAMASFALRPKVTHTPELRRLASAGTTGTGTVSPPVPVETAAGDLMVMVVIGSNTADATATGWVEEDRQDYGASSRITILTKTAGVSESAPTVSDTGSRTQAYIMSFRKNTFSVSAPFNVKAKGTASVASAAYTALGVTTTVANCLVFQIVANEDDVIAADLPVNAALACIHVSATASTLDGNDGGFLIVGGVKLTAGATGTTAGNFASSTTEKGYLTFAIAPRDNIAMTMAVNAIGSAGPTSHVYEFEQRDLAANGIVSVSFAGSHLYEFDTQTLNAAGLAYIDFVQELITQLGPHPFPANGKPTVTFAAQLRTVRPAQFEPRLELDYWPVKPPRPALAGWGLVVNAALEFDYVRKTGTTAQRPTSRPAGWPYFDTTLGALVVWTGSTWATV